MEFIKKLVRPYRIAYFQRLRKKLFEKELRNSSEHNLVVGCSGVYQEGWLPSEWYFLNLLVEEDWHSYFKENSINAVLAEHVWEHLTYKEGKKAAEVCYKFLRKSGNLRIAVPDGFHFSKEYIDYVKIGGSGRGAGDHKVLYDYKLLGDLLTEVGFSVNALEYYDENQNFHEKKWDDVNGIIHRSKKFGYISRDGIVGYTSLIIDAKKP